jgi:hypothetical protein
MPLPLMRGHYTINQHSPHTRHLWHVDHQLGRARGAGARPGTPGPDQPADGKTVQGSGGAVAVESGGDAAVRVRPHQRARQRLSIGGNVVANPCSGRRLGLTHAEATSLAAIAAPEAL